MPGAQADPQRLGQHDLLDAHRRGQQRVVGALVLPLDERPEDAAEDGREQDRRGDGADADELDVVDAADRVDQRAEAEAERQQVDDRLHDRAEGRRSPERREVDDLAGEDALDAGALRGSLDHLPGEQDEDVLERRRAHVALGQRAVRGLRAEDRDARARATRLVALARARPPRRAARWSCGP